MDFAFYSQATGSVPDLSHANYQVSNETTQQTCASFTTSEDEELFKINNGGGAVKMELRYAIEAKRAGKGLDMPILEQMHRLPKQLTIEEEERRRVRRERNKVAASRCRVKRKCHVRRLLKESDDLTKSNNSLQNEINKLEYEKQKLEGAIKNHACKMSNNAFLEVHGTTKDRLCRYGN
ncbi:protein FosB-like [Clytia hemisphaerica]|uniref:BZIP domain-containing protein n=2 Tax=Clytia hemisphaerica TaxID=252671 RepID=A0A7M5XHQ2_9CNID|eukprot:TCONS_00021166-protein